MANEKTPEEFGSITEKADKAGERISEISNVSRTINQMQKKVNQEIEGAKINVGEFERIEEVQSSMIKVLNQLSSTVGSVGQGFARIASDTATASKDAVQQYGKAISQDISFNKQNIVAMALARSSPIFGYFAAKFVETDVFQSAKEKMKANIADALSGVTSKFKQGFGRLLGGGKGVGTADKELRTIKSAGEGAVPKMQSGGYVERAGLAYLHPAEVVMPIEKVLEKIEESIDITKDLANISRQAQLKTLAKMSTYVEGVDRMEKVGIFRGFLRALSDVQMRHTQPAEKRMLRAVLSIQDSIGATIGTWPQVWQKVLVEHPTFRNMVFALNSLKQIIGTPVDLIYQLFKERGGYAGHLSKSRNPMQAAAENIGLVYTGGMWRLDNIAMFTRATAEATRDISNVITGKKYKPLEGISTGTFSIFKIGLRLLAAPIEAAVKKFATDPKTIKKWTGARETYLEKLRTKYSTRHRELKGVYGEGGLVEGTYENLLSPIKKIIEDKKAIPVIDYNAQKLLEYQEEESKINKKSKSYLRDLVDVSEEMNDREERRTFFSFLTGGAGMVKNLLSTAMGFLGPLFMGGGVTGILRRVLQGAIISPLKTAVSRMIPLIVNSLSNPAVISAMTSVLGPAIAGALGYAVGTKLDQMLGITEKIQGSLDKQLEAGRSKAEEVQKGMFESARIASKEGGMEGFQARALVGMQAQLGRFTKERGKDIGFFGRTYMTEVDAAQRQYMKENLNQYMKYDPMQVALLREKWLSEGGMRGKAIGEDPSKYGHEREKAFLTYLYRNAERLSESEIDSMYRDYQIEFAKAHPLRGTANYISEQTAKGKKYIYDKATGIYKDVSKLAQSEVDQMLAQGAVIVDELQAQGAKASDAAKKTAGAFWEASTRSATMISTTVNNASKVISSGASRGYNELSDTTKAVLKGNLFED